MGLAARRPNSCQGSDLASSREARLNVQSLLFSGEGKQMRSIVRTGLVLAGLLIAPTAGFALGPGTGGGGSSGGNSTPSGAAVGYSAQEISQLLIDAGFQSEVQKDSKNNQYVVSNFWGGQPYAIAYPSSCNSDGSGCKAMQIFVNIGKNDLINQAWMDAWNTRELFAKVVKLSDGSVVFDWDFLITGVTPDNVKLAAALFKQQVDASANFKP